MSYTVSDWVTEMGMRAIAEATEQGHYGVVAELIASMGTAGLLSDKQLANPNRSRQVARPGDPVHQEPLGRYPLVDERIR